MLLHDRVSLFITHCYLLLQFASFLPKLNCRKSWPFCKQAHNLSCILSPEFIASSCLCVHDVCIYRVSSEYKMNSENV